jgi:hypothetical protein
MWLSQRGTDDVTIWRIRVAYWISKATYTHAHADANAPGHLDACAHTDIAFPRQQCFANAPHCYIIRAFRVLFISRYKATCLLSFSLAKLVCVWTSYFGISSCPSAARCTVHIPIQFCPIPAFIIPSHSSLSHFLSHHFPLTTASFLSDLSVQKCRAKTVNWIRARPRKRWRFKHVWDESDAHYDDFVSYGEVRWLKRGDVLFMFQGLL